MIVHNCARRPPVVLGAGRSSRIGSLARGAALALAALASGCKTDFGPTPAPFRCTDAHPECPVGYDCIASLCLRTDAPRFALLSSNMEEAESAFTVTARTNDAAVCWTEPLESRQPPVVYAAVIGPSGGLVIPRRVAIPVPNDDTLVRVRASCTAYRDDRLLIGLARQQRSNVYLFQLFETDRDVATARELVGLPFPESTVTGFRASTVGEAGWFTFVSQSAAGSNLSRVIRRVVATESGAIESASGQALALPAQLPEDIILSNELHPGQTGAWLSLLLARGEVRNAWLPHDGAPIGYFTLTPPAPVYRAAFPVASRGDELAIAYRLDDTHWTIQWASPPTGTAITDGGAPSVVATRPGPAFTMPSELVRPGAVAMGDQLLLAGSLDGHTLDVWTTTWGGTAPPVHAGSINKISALTPRRVAITAVGGQLQLIWTERVPENSAGFTEYTVLYAAGLRP